MKEMYFKGAFAALTAGLLAYLEVMLIPLAVLISVMILDYCTGMVKAWVTKSLDSSIGLIGIVKKLCYLLVVCVGGIVDWLLYEALAKTGIEYSAVFFVGLLIVIWLIINELISILENLAIIGVPFPSFLNKIVSKLKVAVEKKADMENTIFKQGD